MNLTEDLQRLDQLRNSGDLTPEQYAAEKSRLLDSCVSRIEAWYQKPTFARVTPRVQRGLVRSISFLDLQETAVLWLDTRRVTIKRIGRPISIAVGDRLLVVGAIHNGTFQTSFYINESNGDNSVDESRKLVRKTIGAGALGMLSGCAILVSVALGALREPTLLSAGGGIRIAIYVISVAAAHALGVTSFFVLWAGGLLHLLLRMINREHLSNAG
jgi:hypothetical protein